MDYFILSGWTAMITLVISNFSSIPLLRIFKEKAPEIYTNILGGKIGPLEQGFMRIDDLDISLRLEKAISKENKLTEIKKKKIYYLFKISLTIFKIAALIMILIVLKVIAVVIYLLLFRPWE